MTYPAFAVTVDLVVLTIREDTLQVLVVQRGEAPFKNKWALPGGFVREDEDLDTAAARELEEETALTRGEVHLEQLATFGAPHRDPRMRVVTVAYLALAADLPQPRAGTDAADARWQPVDELLDNGELAFDHAEILHVGVARARSKLEYTPLGTAFCPPEFTVSELRRVYEVVWGTQLDPRNFHRKATKTEGFLVPTDYTTTRDGGRPARLYRAG
ncbi:MAG TPA: NUDIX domain-containing protein, partial [Jiangellaceae bacterium]